jgi:PRC-barrel domain
VRFRVPAELVGFTQGLHSHENKVNMTAACQGEHRHTCGVDTLSAEIGVNQLRSSNMHTDTMAREMPGSHEHRETYDLIGSDKVEGTNVYRSNGEKIGQIERVMLGKRSGKVAYAVMNFGGFLGLGHDHYPIPWARLTYNEKLGGYEVNVSNKELEGAPKYDPADEWKWDRDNDRRVSDYYGVPGYWM